MDASNAGTLAGAGTFTCDSCGAPLAVHELDEVRACPACGSPRLRRALLAGSAPPAPRADQGGRSGWLADARDGLLDHGDYLAFEERGAVRIEALRDGWTRVGRSLSAQVRLEDPTVSRRHALLYRDETGTHILDDHSLNGVFRNGERVQHAELEDGDEIAVGRYRIHFISLGGAPGAGGAPTDARRHGAIA